MALDQPSIARIAAQYNMPPSVLFGLSQVRAIDNVADLETQAQALAQAFTSTGSWEAAVSTVVAGDPSAYQSPTSPVGGTVNAIMGIAAARPTWGLAAGWRPASSSLFNRGAGAFSKSISALSGLGGVVTPDHAKQWNAAVGQVRQAAQPSGSFAPTAGRSAGAAPFQFEAMPFDAKYLGAMTEGYGDRSGPGGYAEQGNDYGLPHGTAVKAPISGTVRVVRPANPHSGTGLTVYIRRPDGAMAYLGHLGTTDLKDGDQVQADQPIATSGGVPGVDEFPGNSTGAHIEIGIIGADGTLYDPRPVLEGAAKLPQGGAAAQVPTAAPRGQGAGARTQQQPTTDPKAVAGFAQALKGIGVTPEEFSRGYPHVALTRRRLLGLNTSLDDYAPHAGQPPDQVLASVRATPHPRYPEHTVGAIFDMQQTASLHAEQALGVGTQPLMRDVARFVSSGFGKADVARYYQDQAPQPVAPPDQNRIEDRGGSAQNPQGAGDNVVDMPKRQGGPR